MRIYYVLVLFLSFMGGLAAIPTLEATVPAAHALTPDEVRAIRNRAAEENAAAVAREHKDDAQGNPIPTDHVTVIHETEAAPGPRVDDVHTWILALRTGPGVMLQFLGVFHRKDQCDRALRLVSSTVVQYRWGKVACVANIEAN